MEEVLIYSSGILVLFAVIISLFIFERKRRLRLGWPRDVVVVHKVAKGPAAPSLSPFCIKLETYLRLADIKYVSDYTSGVSCKGKTPWITYNDDKIADSQFCIDYLNKYRGVDLNKHLTAAQKAVATAFQRLVEDNLYWTMITWRWVHYDEVNWAFLQRALGDGSGFFRMVFLCRRFWRQAWGHGIGRHSKLEVMDITDTNMKALSEYLGDNTYMMGSTPCELDCTVFGMLCQIMYQMPGSPHELFIKEKYGSLEDYCTRMKEKYWPDWDNCIMGEKQGGHNPEQGAGT